MTMANDYQVMLVMDRKVAEELNTLLKRAHKTRVPMSDALVEKQIHLQLELESIAKDAEHRVFLSD
jgi:hypothetical protein